MAKQKLREREREYIEEERDKSHMRLGAAENDMRGNAHIAATTTTFWGQSRSYADEAI
jgi:hypothetical protein